MLLKYLTAAKKYPAARCGVLIFFKYRNIQLRNGMFSKKTALYTELSLTIKASIRSANS